MTKESEIEEKTMRNKIKKNIPFILLLMLISLVTLLSVLAKPERSKTEAEHWIEYYEAKLDWYEQEYNIDLDENPNEFIEWFKEKYPETYEFLKEKQEDK